jgi:hypothetical protein
MSDTEARVSTAVVLVALLLAAGWALGAFGGPALRRKAAAVAVRVGLADAGRHPAFVARVRRRQRLVLVGIALGVLAATLTRGSVALIWAGLAVGALADQLAAPAAPPGAPRVAHPTGTSVTDYVPAWLLSAVAAGAAGAALLALLWSVAPRRTVPPASAGTSGVEVTALVAVAAAGLAGSLLLARFLVGRRQRAASTADLATDDAFRAQAVGDALHLTAALSVAVAFGLATALQDDDVIGIARQVGGWAPLVLLVAVAVVGTVHELTGGPRHWRRLHQIRQPA